jgi:hypothetical protein
MRPIHRWDSLQTVNEVDGGAPTSSGRDDLRPLSRTVSCRRGSYIGQLGCGAEWVLQERQICWEMILTFNVIQEKNFEDMIILDGYNFV